MTRSLLWVDDDGPRRFRYESRLLRQRNWEPVWAVDIATAVGELTARRFAALILDQSLPFYRNSTPTGIEGGYVLLHWLRRGTPPTQHNLQGQGDVFTRPSVPHSGNVDLPAIIISGNYDVDLAERIYSISKADAEIEIAPKPIDEEVFLGFFNLLPPPQHDD